MSLGRTFTQTHPATRPNASWATAPHVLHCTKLFAPLYEVANRPDLQWFCASAYYVLAFVSPSGEELDAVARECVDAAWSVADCFSTISAAVRAAGVALVPTRLGACDFVDGSARITCCATDKLLLLLVLTFGSEFEWIDGPPLNAPEPVCKFIRSVQNWAGRRMPLAHF